MAKQPSKARKPGGKSQETVEETSATATSATESPSDTAVDLAVDAAESADGPDTAVVMTDPQLADADLPDGLNDGPARDDIPDPEVVRAEAAATVVATDPQLSDRDLPEDIAVPDPETPADQPSEPQEDQATAPASPPPAAAPARSPSALPLVLGGLLAGGIGYGIATLQYPDQMGAISALEAQVGQLSADLAALPAAEAPDLSGIDAALADLGARIDALPGEISALEDRLATLERQPSADGTLQETALAAFEGDLAALRDQIAAMTDAAESQLDATRQEARAIEENALAAARAATARAVLARVQAGLETGAPIGAALAELGDVMDAPVPDALTTASDGVPTLADLQDAFPEAARSALATARALGADGEEGGGGLGAFLRNQFDVRSVTPRDGASVDAVLSRAEDALRNGRLSDALAEVATLPEGVRAELSDWTALAETRAAALDAAEALATDLNDS